VRRIGGLVVIIHMASFTGIGCAGVIAVMANEAVGGNRGMRSSQSIVVVMIRESSRLPARIGSMTGSASGRDRKRHMSGIGRLVVIVDMARSTFGRGTAEAAGMAIQAGSGDVCTCQRKTGIAVIKASLLFTGRMTCITGDTVVFVAPYARMLRIGLRFIMFMAVDATEEPVIGRIGMTFNAIGPCAFVFARVDRKILSVMIHCGRDPCILIMTRFTIGRELC